MKVTIADSLFFQYGKTIKLGDSNIGIPPTYFEWELADPGEARFVTDSHIKLARGPGQIALLTEAFFLHPENYLSAMEKPFDHVLTHSGYFALNKGWLWYPHGGSYIPFDSWKVYRKTKSVSILLSPKNTMRGHRLRHEVVEAFGDRLDVFGLDGYVYKQESVAPYRYSVIIENEKTLSYFTEKLIDCLSVGTVPIYWGCPNIGDFFDARGIIQVENLEEIGRVLAMADEESYKARRKALTANLKEARQYAIPEDWIYKHYPQLFDWERK